MNMKRYFTIALFFCYLISTNAQAPFIRNNGTFKYFRGTSEPSSSWKNVGFDDSNWIYADTAIIGYGWVKQRTHNRLLDSLVINKTTSLYIRSKFIVDDVSKYKDLSMVIDFDDAFIAYINGTEVARVNIGKKGEFVAYNRLADRSHEAHVYRSYTYLFPVEGYYIDSTKVKSLLKKGENVFSFQVHNDSVNGSDLTFNSNIYNLNDCPDFTNFSIYANYNRYIRQTQLDSSKFPIIFINTDEYDQGKFERVVAQMNIIDKKTGNNKISDPIDFTGRISIERRGESSKLFAKMAYNIETQNPDGTNMDTSIMGMPRDNDWILNGNFADKSQIRNEFVFTLGRKLDHYEPRTKYCELVYNGEYLGLYLFVEKIKRGDKRVNVAKRDSIHPEDGGYVFKFDKPYGSGIHNIYPKADEITINERNYLQGFWKSFADTIVKSRKFLDPKEGYKKYVSGKSLIDFVIINELTKNCDAYLYSTYLHKESSKDGGLIKYGPLWDYDLAFGGASWQEGDRAYGWQYEFNTDLKIKELFRDTSLTSALKARWWRLRESTLSTDSLMFDIDSLTSLIEGPRNLNYTVWPVLDKFLFGPDHYSISYDDDVQQMKNWLNKRLLWIDDNIDKLYYAPLNTPTLQFSSTIVQVYPNPFADHINVRMMAEDGTYTINLQSLDGKILCTKTVNTVSNQIVDVMISNSDLSRVSSGVYFVIVQKDGQIVQAKKVIKQ
jgi:hypothetical protein